jgi:tRNA pseudouridine65 synthase
MPSTPVIAVPPPGIELLFVDEHVVAVNKPSGLLVHRGWDDDEDVAMFRVRDAIGAKVSPVHRLDRGTSGALLFARTTHAASTLGRDFERGLVEKRYLALVRGTPPDAGVIDQPVPKKEGGERVPARTRFRRIARSTMDRCSLVEAMPQTGRLHQIRRHLKHLNHPLVGDVNYGSGEINRHYRAQYGLHRLALHAHGLAFWHPVSGTRIVISAPMPNDLSDVLDALGLPRSVEVNTSENADASDNLDASRDDGAAT